MEEYQNYRNNRFRNDMRCRDPRFRRHDHNRSWFGFAILLVGVLILARHLGLYYFSFYHMWPIILIALGILIGIKHRFRNVAPFILIAVGAANLIPPFEIWGASSRELAVPAGLIMVGLIIMLRPKRQSKYLAQNISSSTISEDVLNIDVTFGGRKAIVTSKQFKGGVISTAFGGVELNLMQADSTEPMVLDLKVSFGGVEMVVPSHWEVQVDIQPTFGNVEDHRAMRTTNSTTEERRLLILRGSCSFGNVELKSY